MTSRNRIALVGFLLTVIGVQLLTKWTGTAFYLTQLTMTAYYSLVIVGLCLLMGYAGQISLGHAGFFAIGGYLSGALTTHNLTPWKEHSLILLGKKLGFLVAGKSMYGDQLLTVHPWLACLVALLVTTLIAFGIGIPVLKLKGHYLAMATLGFGTIIFRLALASKFFGQADGISEVPAFPILPGLAVSGDFKARVANYYIAWGLVFLAILLLLNLIHSRVGRALRAIHGSEEAARAMGVNTAQFKLKIFVLSAFFAALAGICLTHYNGGIGPSEAGIMKSVRYVAIVAIGGMASLWGTLIMGVILNLMSLRGLFGTYDDAVFGTILILIMLFAPEGLLRLQLWPRLRRVLPGGRAKLPKLEGQH